jgi:hypothetical protein
MRTILEKRRAFSRFCNDLVAAMWRGHRGGHNNAVIEAIGRGDRPRATAEGEQGMNLLRFALAELFR